MHNEWRNTFTLPIDCSVLNLFVSPDIQVALDISGFFIFKVMEAFLMHNIGESIKRLRKLKMLESD